LAACHLRRTSTGAIAVTGDEEAKTTDRSSSGIQGGAHMLGAGAGTRGRAWWYWPEHGGQRPSRRRRSRTGWSESAVRRAAQH
jgi:hypothetical protein